MADESTLLRVQEAMERQSMAERAAAEQERRRVPSEGPLSDFMTAAGLYIANRTPGVAEHMHGGPQPPDTMAATLGGMAPGVGLSFLLPGAGPAGMLAQGGLSAGLEALRPDATGADIMKEGVFGAAGTAAGDLLGRALGGMAARVQSRIGKAGAQIVRTQSESLQRLADTLGGLGKFNQQQQHVITKSWVRAIGESADNLSPEVRRAAAERIGKVMDASLPTGPVDVTEAFTLLDDIPSDVFPGKGKLLALVAKAETDPKAYQAAMGALRESARTLRKSAPGWDDQAVKALSGLADAGEAAGAADTRLVREQYKNLMMLESIPTVRNTGQVPALTAANKVQQGFGNSVGRGKTEHLLPETADAVLITQAAAEEAASRFRSSGTAERGVQAEAAQDALGLLTGATNPSALVRTAGTLFGVGPLAGLASQGAPAPLAGRIGAATTREKE